MKKLPNDSDAARAAHLAPIVADAVYPLQVFYRLTGLEEASVRAMREKGFKSKRVGKRTYVIGRHFLDYCLNQADDVA